mgnify:CR=1 FL=1
MKSKMILLAFLLTIPALTQPTQKEMKKVDPLSAELLPTILNAPERGRDASERGNTTEPLAPSGIKVAPEKKVKPTPKKK